MEKQRILIFRPEHDMPGKKDVTYAFKPEAEKFKAAICTENSKIAVINNKLGMKGRQKQVLDVFEEANDDPLFYDGVAFFCHGWSSGIQLGFKTGDTGALADYIQAICGHSITNVPLYCCSTGAYKKDKITSPGTGDGSFADNLRDALCARGADYCRVTAHTTVAHTTKNPYALFFDGMGTPFGGVGGFAVVAPGSPLWPKWRKALQNTDLRFRFPFMEVSEIHAELMG